MPRVGDALVRALQVLIQEKRQHSDGSRNFSRGLVCHGSDVPAHSPSHTLDRTTLELKTDPVIPSSPPPEHTSIASEPVEPHQRTAAPCQRTEFRGCRIVPHGLIRVDTG